MNIDISQNPSTSPPLTTTALDAIVQQIEVAFAADDIPRTLELLHHHVLEAWFGMNPQNLFRMFTVIQSHGLQLSPVLTAIQFMMVMAAGNAEAEEQAADISIAMPAVVSSVIKDIEPAEQAGIEKYVRDTGRAFTLRVQGRPVEALRVSEGNGHEFGGFQTLFASHGGYGLFNSLQQGLTAMLAGDFRLAEAQFAEAKLHPSPPSLPFLTRDAHLKSAVLHACFGDPVVARAELAIADQQPKTNSWVEAVIDAQTDLVRALVGTESSEEAIKLLESIQVSTLGEMWPFYAYAVNEVFERANQPTEARRRLEILDQTRLPRVDRQGFTGSVLPSLFAFSDLTAGNAVGARAHWQRVDHDLVISKLGSAVLSLSAGDARESIRIAMDLRARTRTLRQLELLRLSILASSFLLLDDEAACLEVLRTAQKLPRGLSIDDVRIFHVQLHDFAMKHLAAWPAVSSEDLSSYSRVSLDVNSNLTQRELDMLTALARGLTREQIANELFLSVNTVKAHQQTLYRKLGVTNKNAAVITGEQRGLI